jgi:hypothetical protein
MVSEMGGKPGLVCMSSSSTSFLLPLDMLGYDGISDVVFTVLQRVMEAHASSQGSEHQLVINKAPQRTSTDEQARTSETGVEIRSMKPVTGFEQGWKLAEVRMQ